MARNTSENKYNLGLALSGGGAKGFAHLGVIRALEEFGLVPEIISGTSAGALAGVFYADGYSPEEIISFFVGREFKEFAELQVPKAGIFNSGRFRKFLKKHLRAKTFEELRIPLIVVTTDLDDGLSVSFTKGPLIDPIVASCSIPIIFNPVLINGVHYVDGGLFKNFPVSNIRGICNKVIGVNAAPLIPKKYNQNILHIAERSYHYMFRANSLLDRHLCDLLIETDEFAFVKTFDLENPQKVYELGYNIAKKTLLNLVEKQELKAFKNNKQRKMLLS